MLLSCLMSAVTMKSKLLLLLLPQYSYRLNDDQTASKYMEQALQVAESLID